MATKAERLPSIYCNGYSFFPKNKSSDNYYSIGYPIEEQECVISGQENGKKSNPVTVDPRKKHSIVLELKFLGKYESARLLSTLGGLVSTGATAYLCVARKNYRFAVISAAATGVFVVGYLFFNRWCKRISFNIANKVISTHLDTDQLVYKRSQYGLS